MTTRTSASLIGVHAVTGAAVSGRTPPVVLRLLDVRESQGAVLVSGSAMAPDSARGEGLANFSVAWWCASADP